MPSAVPPTKSRAAASRRAIAPVAAVFLACAPALLAAQQRPAADGTRRDSTARLVPVVTTVTRAPLPAASVPRRLDVIGRDVLERSLHQDAADLLKKEAGADVIQFGGFLSGVGLRGFRPQYSGIAQRTLLLVDGRPAGVTNAAMLDLGDAESIEVLRGPASALYGSSAMGGVVNVISRRRTGAPGGSVAAGAGSFGGRELRVEAGGALWRRAGGAQLDADVSVRRVAQTEDFRIGRGNVFRDLVGADSATQILGDGTRQRAAEIGDGAVRANTSFRYDAAAARLGYAFGNGLRVDARGERFAAEDAPSPGSQFDAGSDFPGLGRKDNVRWSGDVALSGAIGRHTPLVRAYYAEETGAYYNSIAADRFTNFATDVFTRGLQLQDAVRVGAQQVVAGVDVQRTDADSWRRSAPTTAAAPFSPNAAQGSVAAFGELRWSALAGRLTGTVGARADRITLELKETALRTDVAAGTERFNVVTPSAAVLARVTERVAVRASAGQAFVAPDAFAKAGIARTTAQDGRIALAAGNPLIDPERSTTVDVGLVVRDEARGLDLDVGYFATRVDDRITAVRANFPEGSEPTTADGATVARVETRVNAAEAALRGVEARLGWDVGAMLGRPWSLRLSGTATRMLTAEERLPAVSVDVARFAGATGFSAAQVNEALVFGAGTVAPVKNVADLTMTGALAWDDNRRFSARLGARYVGERRDLDFTTFVNDVESPAFLVVDAAAGVRLTRQLRLDLLVANLSDENYYELRGYNLQGRSLTARLRAAF